MKKITLITDEYIYLVKKNDDELLCAFHSEKEADDFIRINNEDHLNLEIIKLSYNPKWVKKEDIIK